MRDDGSRSAFVIAPNAASRSPIEVERIVADELAPMRARLLRRAAIAHRGRVLDLGAGHGIVTAELRRRAGGPVTALDRHARPDAFEGEWVCADACALPFEARSFDLVFAQQSFLWIGDPDRVLAEIARVLAPGGALAALEPDFSGMIEQPPAIAIAEVWRAALTRAGARIDAGSALVTALGRTGWSVQVELASAPTPADAHRYDRLGGLPLTDDERARLHAAAEADCSLTAATRFVHTPYLAILASRA